MIAASCRHTHTAKCRERSRAHGRVDAGFSVLEVLVDGRRIAVPADGPASAELRRRAAAERRYRWQLDVSAWLIGTLERLGLATHVQRIAADALARKRVG